VFAGGILMSQNIVSIKGTKNGLLILLNPDYHFEIIKQELQEKLSASKGFFIGAKFQLHSPDKYSAEEKIQLTQICCENGLVPQDNGKIKHDQNVAKDKTTFRKGLTPEETHNKCLLLRKNIRNGQFVQYDGHIVVLGNVHRGAELIAGGNILVMGSLKGIAHAGANGDTNATIMAYSLQPTQLRIAGIIGLSDKAVPKNPKPELAYLADKHIIVEEYDPNRSLPMIS
jgi:septum site-determining protein MinC